MFHNFLHNKFPLYQSCKKMLFARSVLTNSYNICNILVGKKKTFMLILILKGGFRTLQNIPNLSFLRKKYKQPSLPNFNSSHDRLFCPLTKKAPVDSFS